MKPAMISDQIHPDLEEACKLMKAHQYFNIELHNVFGKTIEQCSDDETNKIKEILHTYNMKVANIASTIFFLCPLYPTYQISLFNQNFYAIQGTIEDHFTYLHRACKIAKQLDCSTVRIFPFRFPDNKDVGIVGDEQGMLEIIKHIKIAVSIATTYDIILVLENCPYSHLPKGKMTLRIIQAIQHPNLALLWDPANSYRADKARVPKHYQQLTLEEEYETIKNHIQHIHLKNYHYEPSLSKPFVHCALQSGDIAMPKLLTSLNHQYTGYLSLEPEVSYEETLQSMLQLQQLLEI